MTKRKSSKQKSTKKEEFASCRAMCRHYASQKSMTEEKLLALVEKNYPRKTCKLSEVRFALAS